MPFKIYTRLTLLLFLILLTACAPAATPQVDLVPLAPTQVVDQATRVVTLEAETSPTPKPSATKLVETIVPTRTPAPTAAPVTLACASAFEKREMQQPYQPLKKGQPRYTLSTEELGALFGRMGIKAMCIPADLGAPFVNADWDKSAGVLGVESGKMISLGFEGLYPGAGWSQGFVVAATYDFRGATEYDTFATPEDNDAIRNGKLPNRAIRTFQTAGGLTGFQRVAAGLGMGTTPLYMTFVIPSQEGYVAVVYTLGNYEGDLQGVMDNLSKGQYPDGVAKMVAEFAAVAESVEE